MWRSWKLLQGLAITAFGAYGFIVLNLRRLGSSRKEWGVCVCTLDPIRANHFRFPNWTLFFAKPPAHVSVEAVAVEEVAVVALPMYHEGWIVAFVVFNPRLNGTSLYLHQSEPQHIQICPMKDVLWANLCFSENQACTELRSTISRHLLPPIPRWGKTVDSYIGSCRNSRTPHREGGFSGTQFPLGKDGAKATQNGNHDLVHAWFSLIFSREKIRAIKSNLELPSSQLSVPL